MKTFTNCNMITSQKFSLCGSYLHYKRNLVHFHGLNIINTAMSRAIKQSNFNTYWSLIIAVNQRFTYIQWKS